MLGRALYSVIMLLVVASLSAAQEKNKARLLVPGETVERFISAGEVHQYRITLGAGQFVRLTLRERSTFAVLATLLGRANQKLTAVGSRDDDIAFFATAQGWGLSLAGDPPGNYRLVVGAGDTEVPGRYEIKVDQVRAVTDRDRKRTVAERITAEAEQLKLQRNDAASLHKSLKRFDVALSHWRAIRDVGGEAQTLNSIGVLYSTSALLDRSKALDYFERALARWRVAGDLRGEAAALRNIGGVSPTQMQARDFYNESLRRWQTVGDRLWEARLLWTLASSYGWCGDDVLCGDRQMAREYFQRSLEIWKTLDDRVGMSDALFYLAEFCDWQGERQRARDYYNQAIQQALDVDFRRRVVSALLRLGEPTMPKASSRLRLITIVAHSRTVGGSALKLKRTPSTTWVSSSLLSAINRRLWITSTKRCHSGGTT